LDQTAFCNEFNHGQRASSSSAVVRLYRLHTVNLNQILRPVQRLPQCLKSVRIVAFAFFFDGGVAKSAYRGAQTFDRLFPEVQGFRQSMFQNFALGIKGLLGRWRDRDVSSLGKNRAEPLHSPNVGEAPVPKVPQIGSMAS
jgi:hypothetical protein